MMPRMFTEDDRQLLHNQNKGSKHDPNATDVIPLSHKEKRALKAKKKKERNADKVKKKKGQGSDEDTHSSDEHMSETDQAIDRKNSHIVVTTQQSRFLTVTFDEFGKNVMFNQFTLSIEVEKPRKTIELLRDTQLKLNYGTRYGLIGPNGIGKSTLLQALGTGIIENLPSSLKILYINQLDTTSLATEANSSGEKAVRTVLETVIAADDRVERLKQKIQMIDIQKVLIQVDQKTSALVDQSRWGYALALWELKLLEATEELEKKARTAIKRSGMRGKVARKELLVQEHFVAQLKNEVAVLNEKYSKGATSSVEVTFAVPDETSLLRQIHERTVRFEEELKILDEPSMIARARRILESMGINEAKQNGPITALSGGWQVRVLLARVIFMEPDFLLLDEPTNHLDMPSILWLRQYLLSLPDVLGTPVTLLLVTHDRWFLNELVEEIIEFRGYDKTLVYYSGNYDTFEQTMADKKKFNANMQEKLDNRLAKANASIQKMESQARKSKDDKKMAVAATKKKKIDRIGIERSATGHRFMLNRDRAGYFLTTRDQAEDVRKYETSMAYKPWKMLSTSPPQIRNLTSLKDTTMVAMDKISFEYPSGSLRIQDLTFNVQYGERVILLGRNGAGKTTMMKLLSNKLQPMKGNATSFHGARIASLMQHNVEDLKRFSWSKQLTAIDLLGHDAQGNLIDSDGQRTAAQEGKIRAQLSNFGVTGETAASVPLESLSGGQLVRVSLAWITYPAPPHVLMLDEPTNHLDMSSIEILATALRKYEGAIVLISHDMHFLNVLTSKDLDDDGPLIDETSGSSPLLGRVRVYEVQKKSNQLSLVSMPKGIAGYQEQQQAKLERAMQNFHL